MFMMMMQRGQQRAGKMHLARDFQSGKGKAGSMRCHKIQRLPLRHEGLLELRKACVIAAKQAVKAGRNPIFGARGQGRQWHGGKR